MNDFHGHTEWDWNFARGRVLNVARRVLRDHHDAEDAAQEALMRAWRNRARCLRPDEPLPWMLQIGRNEALRARGMRRRHEHAADDRREESCDPQDPSLLHVRATIRSLEPADRVLILLRYETDLTTRQIAETLAWRESTVRVRLHRLRQRLSAELGDLGDHANQDPQEAAQPHG